VFYGWKIVGITFLTHFISVGFIFYSYGAFFKALAGEFGGSRLGVAVGLAIMNVVAGLISPFLGRAIDRGSVRVIMCVGAVLMAIGFVLLSRIAALWQFYTLLGTVLAFGSAMLGALAGSTLVARWFVARRGTALGIATMGISLSGLAMAPAATQLIATIGWRSSYLVYGIVTFVVVPAVWWLVVDRPEDLGLRPDGVPSHGPPSDPDAPMQGAPVDPMLDPGAAIPGGALATLRVPNFWVIGMVVALNFTANGAVLTHIIPHATDIGYSALSASLVLSAMAGTGVVGKVLFGWVADRIEKRVATGIAIGLQGAGVFLILNVTGYVPLLCAGAVFGLGMGGIVPLWGALIGASFGRQVFGRVMGLMSPVMIPVMSVGIPYAGWIFDRTGSYAIAFRTFVGVYALAAVVLAALRIPEVEPGSVPLTAHEEESEVPLPRAG
jgi:MFS family permease